MSSVLPRASVLPELEEASKHGHLVVLPPALHSLVGLRLPGQRGLVEAQCHLLPVILLQGLLVLLGQLPREGSLYVIVPGEETLILINQPSSGGRTLNIS